MAETVELINGERFLVVRGAFFSTDQFNFTVHLVKRTFRPNNTEIPLPVRRGIVVGGEDTAPIVHCFNSAGKMLRLKKKDVHSPVVTNSMIRESKAEDIFSYSFPIGVEIQRQ